MSLKVVGVGWGRTGTHSLKLALERLLDGPCHHMLEVFEKPEQIPLWIAAADGTPDWTKIFDGYVATVDWPSAGFWRQLVAEYPEAVVLLSRRESADAWWRSADQTIFTVFTRPMADDTPAEMAKWFDTLRGVLADQDVDPTDEEASKLAYDRHLAAVRAEVPADRLIEWTPGEGWGPLCSALGVPEPEEAFPHVNTTEEFRAMLGLDD